MKHFNSTEQGVKNVMTRKHITETKARTRSFSLFLMRRFAWALAAPPLTLRAPCAPAARAQDFIHKEGKEWVAKPQSPQ